MKKPVFSFLIFLISVLCTLTFLRAAPGQELSAKIYKTKIADAADFIATIPTEEEAKATYDKLNRIVEDMKSMLAGKIPPDAGKVERMQSYIIDVFRKTEVIEWCLYQLYENQSISLLPGEGITLTFPSYCLDHHAASPDVDEFFSIEAYSEKEIEWLTPLLDYSAKHRDQELPVQELIWNMTSGAYYQDLPEDQQELLKAAVPDAEKRFRKSKVKSFLGVLKDSAVDEVTSSIQIISDAQDIASRIENRKSKLTLVLPKHDVFELENGLLVRVRSTGRYDALTLTVVHPRTDVSGSQSSQVKQLRMAGSRPGFITGMRTPASFLGLSYSGAIHTGSSVTAFFSAASSAGQKGKLKNWWKENKGRIESASETAGDAVDIIESYNEGGLEGVGDYVKGRGFDEGLDFFKGFQKGNPEAERAFELFRSFNKSFLEAEKDKDNRPSRDDLKPFKPSRRKFKPGRGDVQPLGASGGI